MRTTALSAALALVCALALAQETKTNAPVKITASAAKKHINPNAVVAGKIAEVYRTDRLVRLNFDKPFPNQTFTAVIFADKTNLFPEVEKLKDKNVEISGTIADYRGRPEIILTSTNQLKLREE